MPKAVIAERGVTYGQVGFVPITVSAEAHAHGDAGHGHAPCASSLASKGLKTEQEQWRRLRANGVGDLAVGFSSLFNDERENIRGKAIGVYIVLFAFNIAAWAWAIIAFRDLSRAARNGGLAYSFGLRHAFDADHIAAIDNVTRKLMQEGTAARRGRPVLFARAFHDRCRRSRSPSPSPRRLCKIDFDGSRAPASSSARSCPRCSCSESQSPICSCWPRCTEPFSIVKNGGRFVEEDLNITLAKRGLLARLFRRFFRMIERSWQMYPLGFLFRPGF